MPWYRENARSLPWRKDREPYHVWLSEIMLQQTRVEAVKGYYARFLKKLPTIEALAQAEEEQLLKLWEGLGYYNRARNLKKAAQIIIKENKGVFPSEYSEILNLPGMGEYTAGAIASNCFDEPVAAVDGNVLRVISRITENYDNILKPAVRKNVKKELEKVYPKKDCGIFTQSLMELGAIVCVPNGRPKCEICPVKEDCRAYLSGTQELLPVKEKKKTRKVEEKTVFLLRCGEKTAVRKRKNKGLLAGLWEFPNEPGCKETEEALQIAESWGTRPAAVQKQVFRKHIFTHVQWNMTCFYMQCEQEASGFEWVPASAINRQITLPTAFRQFWQEQG